MQICEHLDFDNERDCDKEVTEICMCCALAWCNEHKGRVCQYGGMGFVGAE